MHAGTWKSAGNCGSGSGPGNACSICGPVRSCFAKYYDHLPEFYIAEEDGDIVGMLPLSWVEEAGRYSFFPGELWQGKNLAGAEQGRFLQARRRQGPPGKSLQARPSQVSAARRFPRE